MLIFMLTQSSYLASKLHLCYCSNLSCDFSGPFLVCFLCFHVDVAMLSRSPDCHKMSKTPSPIGWTTTSCRCCPGHLAINKLCRTQQAQVISCAFSGFEFIRSRRMRNLKINITKKKVLNIWSIYITIYITLYVIQF